MAFMCVLERREWSLLPSPQFSKWTLYWLQAKSSLGSEYGCSILSSSWCWQPYRRKSRQCSNMRNTARRASVFRGAIRKFRSHGKTVRPRTNLLSNGLGVSKLEDNGSNENHLP